MSKKYLLVDVFNAYFRAKHMAPRQADTWTKIGFSLHILLSIVNKSYRKEKVDHVVFCLEGNSWRKSMYAPYKRNRVELREKLTEREQEEDAEMMTALNEFIDFIQDKTNVTVLRNEIAEADDMIARWIHQHPDDNHTILSSDSDFYQLLAENVQQYNGVNNQLITPHGYFDDLGRRVKETVKKRDSEGKLVKETVTKKTPAGKVEQKTIQVMVKQDKPPIEPKWELFQKCMRGDTSDNIFSAYPGVRTNGSKGKPGLLEAFEDMNKKGFKWNNIMLTRWEDHKGDQHRVLDDYTRNVSLVDLTAQPEDVLEYIDETVQENSVPKNKPRIGRHFLMFCGKYDLRKVQEFSSQYNEWLKADYA